MGGNDWFPLAHRRLRKSKWWRRASDLARARNVMLWGEAYDATPAGSLPDDDDELAEAAGFGLDVEKFLLHKAEIMAPWVLCADERWYHPTVCEVVLETWELQSTKRRKAAERKKRSRDASRGVTPEMASVTCDNPLLGRDGTTQTDSTDRRGRTKGSKKPFATSSPREAPEARRDGASGLRVIEGGAKTEALSWTEAVYRARLAMAGADPGLASELAEFISYGEAVMIASVTELRA